MPDVTPHPKEAQTQPGRPRRYRRKVAGPKQWAAIRGEKITEDGCRLGGSIQGTHIELHHLVPRSQGGDDLADNLVPLCSWCHAKVTERDPSYLYLLSQEITDAEYAYIIGKLGEAGPERLFGVNR